MASVSLFHSQLSDRRQRLERARIAHPESQNIERLLGEVDAALHRLQDGTFGICETCGDPVEPDRLAADPLVRFCLDHLSEDERRAIERDIELAVQIQSTLLPSREFRAAEWEACFHYQPAGAVSGDYCDLIPAGDAGVFFFTGDVAGKGVAAALLMSHLHAIFRSLVQFGIPLAELMARANRVFAESTGPSKYATLLCGYAGSGGHVQIANAGHCPPVLIRRSGIETVDAGGLPLGLFSSADYEVHETHLEPGESLILYTDGVTEARDPAGSEYGPERLEQALIRCRPGSPRELVDGCLGDFRRFLAGTSPTDDVTVLAIRRTGPAE